MKKIIYLLLVMIIFITGCRMFDTTFKESEFDFKNLQDEVGLIEEFTIYGRYFNIKGEITKKIDNLILVLKNEKEEIEYGLITEFSDSKTKFKTNELINSGINLENIKIGDYVILLKSDDFYYTLKNKTSYKDLEYYTLTKNNSNNKINISFSSFNNKSFLYLECKEIKDLNNIYDIVIDAGHGGSDPGAIKNGYYESNINLDYTKTLKEELSKLGLKIKLTRDSDTYINTYGSDGRVSIPYKTKAKLMLSIHMNSTTYNIGNGGVEIYVPNNIDTSFASKIAKNIVDYTSTNYSKNKSNKLLNGVYLKTFSKSDLENIKEEAIKKGYTPYEKATLDTVYYYIIRETGGIITGAYVDNRNKDKEWNHYYNSNHGCESYLLELGYINSSTNLKILLTEKDKYVKAIVNSIKEYLEI